MNRRRILCSCVLALLVLGLLGAGPAAATREMQKGRAADDTDQAIEAPDEAANVPIMLVYRGYGFAFTRAGEEIHTLRILIFKVRSIDPPYIRGLMEKDKSIAEIKGEIIERGWASFYHGDMRFAGAHYTLANISLTRDRGADDNLTINADVMKMLPVQAVEPGERAGTITITTLDHEGIRIGTGMLTMDGEEYQVVLELLPPLPNT
ncbi:MAG: hypothetical protein EFT35_09615 [Methanophagales archaeon ANME-1-THS]|nr:MAG: hypothetical protein EFT35_09615 [Methanophagales archaeon ANME-1-THS]